MNSGMYSPLSGAVAAQQRLDVLANNMANANTPGFKKDRILFASYLSQAATAASGNSNEAPVLSQVRFDTDFTPGPLKKTDNTFDVALDGEGFFVVNTPQGRAYTRQGNFHLDTSGKIVTNDGYEVLGGGPITITGSHVEVDAKGGVLVDGAQVATLDIVDFPRPYSFEKRGAALFIPTNPQDTPQPARTTGVKQGFLEQSNVSPVLEMVRLIEANRTFESCAKAVRAYDDIAARAANDLGKTG